MARLLHMAPTKPTRLSPPNLTHSGRLLRLQNLLSLFLAKWMCGIISHLPTDWFLIPQPHIAARSVTPLMRPTLNAFKVIVSQHVTGADVPIATSLATRYVSRRNQRLPLLPLETTMPLWPTLRTSKRTRPHDLIPPPLPRPHVPCRPLCRKRQNQRFTLCVLVEHAFQP